MYCKYTILILNNYKFISVTMYGTLQNISYRCHKRQSIWTDEDL